MPKTVVHRPIVRTFKSRFVKEAVAWVKQGGHAVYWETDKRAILLFPEPDEHDEHDLGAWAVYDLGKHAWNVDRAGRFKGLGWIKVPRDCHEIVLRRAERDSIHPGPTRRVAFDCLDCGACCKDNYVVLLEEDLQRFRDGGRPELAKKPYVRKEKDGTVVLTLLRSRDCRNLGRDNKCAIYPVRPHACSEFPVASECCLFARSEGLGVFDGLSPEDARSS